MNLRKQLGCDTFRTEEKGRNHFCWHCQKWILTENDEDSQCTSAYCQGSKCFFVCFFFHLVCITADPEEFITVLFKEVLCIEPLLKLR